MFPRLLSVLALASPMAMMPRMSRCGGLKNVSMLGRVQTLRLINCRSILSLSGLQDVLVLELLYLGSYLPLPGGGKNEKIVCDGFLYKDDPVLKDYLFVPLNLPENKELTIIFLE